VRAFTRYTSKEENMATIEVDGTTFRLLGMLQDTIADEPEYDSDALGAHGVQEAELKHYEWQRHVGALRLLVGSRLTNGALEQL
jgi:hypothetical protein